MSTVTAPIRESQINNELYVGELGLPNIQAAVNAAAADGGIFVVVIPHGYNAADLISAVVNGSSSIILTDLRSALWQTYGWNGTSYLPASFHAKGGFIATGIASAPPLGSMSLGFDPNGTSGHGSADILVTSNPGTGVPSFNLQIQSADGTHPPLTYLRADLNATTLAPEVIIPVDLNVIGKVALSKGIAVFGTNGQLDATRNAVTLGTGFDGSHANISFIVGGAAANERSWAIAAFPDSGQGPVMSFGAQDDSGFLNYWMAAWQHGGVPYKVEIVPPLTLDGALTAKGGFIATGIASAPPLGSMSLGFDPNGTSGHGSADILVTSKPRYGSPILQSANPVCGRNPPPHHLPPRRPQRNHARAGSDYSRRPQRNWRPQSHHHRSIGSLDRKQRSFQHRHSGRLPRSHLRELTGQWRGRWDGVAPRWSRSLHRNCMGNVNRPRVTHTAPFNTANIFNSANQTVNGTLLATGANFTGAAPAVASSLRLSATPTTMFIDS